MSLFGQTPASTSTGFGSTAPATGFGAAPKPGGFTFGGNTSNTTAPASSLFGGASSTTATTPAFGAPAASTATPANPQQPSLFGATSAAAPTFGVTATSQPQQQQQTGFGGGGLFGGGTSQATAATTTATPSLFGASNTNTSLFGGNTSNTTANTTSSLFGASANKPATTPFGFSSTGSSFNNMNSLQGNMNNMTPQQRDQMIYQLLVQKNKEELEQKGQRTLNDITPENMWQSLALMKSWWDPESPTCKFKTYFYNTVPAQEVHLYQRPPNQDQKAWDDAQKKNPDPTCMVPTLAIGFSDIDKRMEAQNLLSQAHKAKLQEINDKVKKLQETTLLENANKLMEAKRQYMEITQRVIRFLKHTQVLRQKGLSITPEEEMMRTRFESIQDQLQQSEQFHGTLSQMWAQLQLIKESGRKYGSVDGVYEWDSVSPSHVEEITKILDEQQRGIQHTIDVLQRDAKDAQSLQQEQQQHLQQQEERLQYLP
ncbi:nucleoporin complex subunit 54-domain-containing protein [Absidia repens]|uniref:Nucleoporin complex subunit 54-domain-containing protein n=1 Tax=Absidia repens TaxID=90262 RepID=A0A1X2IAL4_9FUNG|nr:nucleoporin complex subunit 54-domain-containing protein [Absidia repens]